MVFLEKILGIANVDLLKPRLYSELVFFFFSKIDLFTVISTFYIYIDQFGNTRRHHWKERLKISKIADVCMVGWGASLCPPPYHTNVCKISRLCGAESSLVFNKTHTNLAILLILRRSFWWCRRIFPNLSMSNVEKKT